jgi:hypothetical protein
MQNRELVANFAINTYIIDVEANNNDFGTVTGAGTYEHFETVTLSATPNTGYHFVNWTENGEEVSDEIIYEFEVDGPRDLVANFAINTYMINVSANNNDFGTVTGAGEYDHFAMATLTATPNTGYHFVNWTANGEEVSDEAIYEFMVEGPRDLIANFAINTYMISATANDDEFGSVTGAGEYEHFETVTLTATPNTGYHFVNWTENGDVVMDGDAPAGESYTFEVDGPRDLVANFAINTYIISATANNDDFGSVTGAGEYEHFETATLTAIPNTGYHFVNWTENGDVVMDGDEPAGESYTFEVDGPRELIANFAINTYIINVSANDDAFGTVSGGGTYEHFEMVTLTASPETGYHFVNWTENGEEVSDELIYEFEVDGPRDLVANFAINTYIIYVSANNDDFGTVTGSGTYEHFETAILTATPNTGYHFVSWTENGDAVMDGDEPAGATYTFTVEGPRELVANFAINTYTLLYIAGENGTIEGDTEQHVEHGADGTPVEAIPDEGYHFVQWSDELTDNPRTDQNVTDDLTVTAEFAINTYTLLYIAGENGSLSGDAEQIVEHGSDGMPVQAIADAGYHFTQWSDGSTDNPRTDTNVTDDMQVTAYFALTTYSITFDVIDENDQPITDAVITFDGTEYAAGHYLFEDLPPDTYIYTVSRDGFFDADGEIELMADDLVVTVVLVQDDTSVPAIEDLSLQAYPNPASHLLTIEADTQLTEVRLLNINGQQVYSAPVNDTRHQVDVSNLRPGIYLLQVKAVNNMMKTLNIQIRPL